MRRVISFWSLILARLYLHKPRIRSEYIFMGAKKPFGF